MPKKIKRDAKGTCVLRKGARAFPYDIRRTVMRMYSDGHSLTVINRETGINKSTIRFWAKEVAIDPNSRLTDEDLDLMLSDWKVRYADDGTAPRAGQPVHLTAHPKMSLALTGQLEEVIATVREQVTKRMQAEDTVAGMLKAGTALAILQSWEHSMRNLPVVEKWADVRIMLDELFAKLDIKEKEGKGNKRQGIDIRILNARPSQQVDAEVIDT